MVGNEEYKLYIEVDLTDKRIAGKILDFIDNLPNGIVMTSTLLLKKNS